MIENAPSASGGAPLHQRVAILCSIPKSKGHDLAYISYVEGEAIGLAEAIELDVCDIRTHKVDKIKPSTYFGEGVLEAVHETIKDHHIHLLYVDTSLTPIQQRNLERRLAVKVIDRTGLILEIFGARATTAEGVLQVELAALSYQKSRLVRSWTHLERQRGGFGFIGGPGESQIELDRRMITQRMVRLKKELERVKKTRQLHRQSRQKVPYPVVALVGYTNAGKSTLFNRLTGAKAFAKDLLFATLDPMMRLVTLPSGVKVILSDTVGFISNLPTHLVAAFRATLEEVLQADLILHVRDLTSPMLDEHNEVVRHILGSLGVGIFQTPLKALENEIPQPTFHPGAPKLSEPPPPIFLQEYIEVLNKMDVALHHDEPRAVYTEGEGAIEASSGQPIDLDCLTISRALHLTHVPHDTITTAPLYISATTGQGVEALLGAIDKALSGQKMRFHLRVPASEGKFLAWLCENTVIYQKELIENIVDFDISIDEKVFKTASQFIKKCFNDYKQR